MKRAGVMSLLLVCTLIVIAATNCEGEVKMRPIPKDQAEWVTRWLLPLPKEIEFVGSAPVAAADLRILTDEDAAELIRCAAEEVRTATGAGPQGDGFPLRIGTPSSNVMAGIAGIPDLASVKNADQAYAIVPIRGSGEGTVQGIALVGHTDTGAYYAARTFLQLLEGAAALAESKGETGLPIVSVRDWPDLAERGEWGPWGAAAKRTIQYMSDRKMNLIEVHNTRSLSFDANGRGILKTDTESQHMARRHAVKWVPVTGHFNSLGKRTGVFKVHPQAEGRGPHAHYPKRDDLVVPCASSPEFIQTLSEWMESCAAQEITDMNFYLTELAGMQCDCEKCTGKSQYVLEAVACVKAWEIARKKYPDFRIRILLSQGTYDVNDQMLAAVAQPEIGVTYYSGSTTYTSARAPMIYPLLADFAREGRWLGCYPQLTASWRVACPWCGPQFIKYRMTELVEKGLACLSGYAPPDNQLFDFNVTAAAEWSWNSTGRDEREFALAWATRGRLPSPEKVADWAVLLGPVGWDVYGAGVPFHWVSAKNLGAQVAKGLPPLGKGLFQYCESAKKIEDNLAVCERAMALAREIGLPALIDETRVITGYMQMLKGLHRLSDIIAGKKTLTDDEKKAASAAMELVDAGSEAAVEGLRDWHKTVAPDVPDAHVATAIRATERTAADVVDVLVKLGVPDARFAHRAHTIGEWKTEDFANGADIRKKWDVTPYITGPGRYELHFIHESGLTELAIRRVALASADPAAPDALTEIAVDPHEGVTGRASKSDRYTLALPPHNPKQKYFIIADIRGCAPNSPPTQQGCDGTAVMRKLRD